MKTCEECGAQTELDDYYRKFKGGVLCPSCIEYHRHERGRRVYKDLLFGVLFSLILLVNKDIPWLFLNLYMILAMMYLSVVPHELGHAFAVWLMRQELLFIRFGSGHRWLSRKVRGVYLDFQTQPLGGFVGFVHRYPGVMRFKDAFVYVCGPLTNIVIFLLIWIVFTDTIAHEDFSKTFSPWLSISAANLILGVGNLIPFKIHSRYQMIPNDGLGIIKSLIGKSDLPNTILEHNMVRAVVAFDFYDYHTCQVYAKRVIEIDNSNVYGRNMLAVSLSNIGDADGAIRITEQSLEMPNVDDKIKPILWSNLSYFYLEKGDPTNYAKALQLSDDAMRNFSWELSVLSNYGGIQVVAGDVDKGIQALRDKRHVISPRYVQAEIHALLAIGLSRKGEFELSKKELNHARKLDSNCKFLERATTAVSMGQG